MSALQTFASRAYGVLMGITAVTLILTGAAFLNWSSSGLPDVIVRTPGFPEVTPEMLLGFAVLGIGALIAATLNLVFAFFAYRGRLWPAVLNTLGWCILLVPTLLHTNGQAIASAIVLAILVGMTAAIGVPRVSRA